MIDRRKFLQAASLLSGSLSASASENPRLFFSSRDQETLRQKLRADPPKTWYAQLKSAAARGLNYTGQTEDTRAKYARDMAFVYLMESGDSYRAKVVEFLKTVGDYDTDWKTFGWAWGGDLLFYAMAYDWIQPSLAKTEDEAIRAKLEAAGRKTFARFTVPPISGKDKYFTNVRLRIAAGLGTAALALGAQGDAKARLDWIVEDLFGHSHEVPDIIACVVAADGIYKEGSSYQNDSFTALAPFLLAYRRVTGVDWFAGGGGRYDDRLRRMFHTNIQLMMPDGGAPTLNTGWIGTSAMHEIVAPMLPDAPLQMWYWNQAYRRAASFPALSIVYYDPALDAAASPPGFKSQILSNAVVFRGGWESDDTWLLMDTSHEPSRSTHDQPDQTSIAVYARKAYLLIDPGDGRNYDDPAAAAWLRSNPVAHNLVIVDGTHGPSKRFAYAHQPDNNWDPAPVKEGFVSPSLDYAETGITNYHDAPGVGTKRSIFFPNREYFVVLDEMLSDSDHSYAQLFHFGGSEGKLAANGGDVRWTARNVDGEAVEMRLIFTTPKVTITSHTGYTNLRPHSTFDHTYIRAQAKGSNVSFLTLLLPRKISERDAGWIPSAGGGTLRFAGHTDVHGIASSVGEWSVGQLTAAATYASARVVKNAVQWIAMKRGTRVSYGGTVWLESSEILTAALRTTDPAAVRVTMTDPGKAFRMRVRTPAGVKVSQVKLNGNNQAFQQSGTEITLNLNRGGELLIR